jgi:YidC/Oxa1 family membrane protein insertase
VDRNLLLAFALSFMVLSLWSMMQPKPPPRDQTLPAAEATAPSEGGPPRYPELALPQPGAAPMPERVPAAQADEAAGSGQTIPVARPLYLAELSSQGATLRDWELVSYHDRHGDRIRLVSADDALATAATPFPELGLGDLSQQIWRIESQSDTEVRFSWQRGGVLLRKTYAFSDDDYDFRLRIDVSNNSAAPIAPAFGVELPIVPRAGNDFREQSAATLHVGKLQTAPLASLGSRGVFGWLTGKKAGEPVVFTGEVDWAGASTPYFLTALFPDQPGAARARFLPLEPGKRAAVQLYYDPVTLQPEQTATREYRAYLGPKEIARLEAFSPAATRSIDLGWSFVAPVTRAFGWMLAVLHSFVPNYGWAIIILTILVRGAMTPLTVKQMRSMERMRRIQPKIKEIQEKFADDRQKQSEAMMSLYRQEKVNPLGGCLPMVLQLPVFIGLFYALRSSIQLRQAPWIGWIDDLSAPDLLFTVPGVDFPVRLMPLLMGASMFVQQKITPMQMDPAQARMMLILMPVMMTVISYSFPSGLVLYWMMSNVLAIAHQLWIGRQLTPAAAN